MSVAHGPRWQLEDRANSAETQLQTEPWPRRTLPAPAGRHPATRSPRSRQGDLPLGPAPPLPPFLPSHTCPQHTRVRRLSFPTHAGRLEHQRTHRRVRLREGGQRDRLKSPPTGTRHGAGGAVVFRRPHVCSVNISATRGGREWTPHDPLRKAPWGCRACCAPWLCEARLSPTSGHSHEPWQEQKGC